MEVNANNYNSAANSPAGGSAASQDFREEYNTFLMLLTTQIRNQDPLAPLDATQFVEQLATFSSLEQQVTTNDYLGGISAMLGQIFTDSANEWIGQEAEVMTSWVPYQGGDVKFTADIPAAAEKAIMTLRDSSGNIVDSQTLDRDDAVWKWDGEMADGDEAEYGLYEMTIDLYQDGEVAAVMEPRIISKVVSVSIEGGQVVLGFENQLTATANSVIRHKTS